MYICVCGCVGVCVRVCARVCVRVWLSVFNLYTAGISRGISPSENWYIRYLISLIDHRESVDQGFSGRLEVKDAGESEGGLGLLWGALRSRTS